MVGLGIMGTKILAILFFIVFINRGLSQGIEEQRKYVIKDKSELVSIIKSNNQLDGFSFYNHSQYMYFDIYLDTPDFDLYKNNLSLRFRKRIFNDSTITYGLQLKSEMLNSTDVRMEVEETELDFYKIKTEFGWIKLTEILDVLFTQVESKIINTNTNEFKLAMSQIQAWIGFKANGIITPFQKLIYLNLKNLDIKKIKTLSPVLLGTDTRNRTSIYINPQTTDTAFLNIPNTALNTNDLSNFFILNPNYIWVSEASLDSATFYPIFKSEIQSVTILEFEVENKYKPAKIGTNLLNTFELSLKKVANLQNGLDSKYKASIKKLIKI